MPGRRGLTAPRAAGNLSLLPPAGAACAGDGWVWMAASGGFAMATGPLPLENVVDRLLPATG